MKKKGFKINFFTLLMAFSIVPLVLAIAVVSCTSIVFTKNNLEETAKKILYIASNNLANHCRDNNISFATSDSYNDYLDSLKDQNIEMGILLDGYPCVTSIKNESDFRVREIEFDKDMTADAGELINGYYDDSVLINEQEYMGYYMPIVANDKIIGMAFAGELRESIVAPINQTIIIFTLVSVIVVVVFLGLMILFTRSFLKSFSSLNHSVIALSQGKLARRKEHASMVKEMNSLMVATVELQENLAEIIAKVQDVLSRLVFSVGDVTQLSDRSAERADQITCATNELSQSTIKMSEHVQDIHTQMLEIGSCVNEISGNVEHLSNTTKDILVVNEEATQSMNTVLTNSKVSVDAVNDIAIQIRETNEAIQQIDTAVELILSISEQSNLLSLNAAIEAARAGEVGKGFAVVADEIGKLAQQSSDGAEAIRNLAQAIIEKSDKSVELAENVQNLMLEEQGDVTASKSKFEELSSNISHSVEEIKNIADETERLTDYKERVIGNVHNLSAISQQTAAGNQEVNASIEEIMSGIQMVSSNCDILNNLAKELEKSVSYFRLEA